MIVGAASSAELARARAAWGSGAPDWIMALAAACDRKGLTAVAEELGVHASLVNAVLCDRYAGDLSRIAYEVRGKIIAAPVDCPEHGKLPAERCREYQDRAERRDAFPRQRLHSLMYPDCRHCELSRFAPQGETDGGAA